MSLTLHHPPSLWGWSSETWKPIHFNMHLIASAQDERVHLKGLTEGSAGALGLSFVTTTGHRKSSIWGTTVPRTVGLDSWDPAANSKCDLGHVTSPQWPLVSPHLSNEGIRPGVSVRVLFLFFLFIFIFLTWTIVSVFMEFVTILLLFHVLVFLAARHVGS